MKAIDDNVLSGRVRGCVFAANSRLFNFWKFENHDKKKIAFFYRIQTSISPEHNMSLHDE